VQNQDAKAHIASFRGSSSFYGGCDHDYRGGDYGRGGHFANSK